MNNFEKWKQSITIDSPIVDAVIKDSCEDCPAYHDCKYVKFFETNNQDDWPEDHGIYCRDCFEEWANKEVK